MRACAILGLGCSSATLRPFQRDCGASWSFGLPEHPQGADVVIIFGGDGTVHGCLAKMVELRLPVLVVPRGSGNDFARALKIVCERDALGAWRRFQAGEENAKAVDLGVIIPQTAAGKDQEAEARYFCCVGGVGLDSAVNRRANQMPRWLRAHGGYALSVLPALLRFTPTRTRIVAAACADGGASLLRSDALAMTAAFANTPAYGGGMQIAPQARLDDGKLDVCVVANMGKWRLLSLFPTIYFGAHLRVPEVDYFQTERLRLETEIPLEVYADGEYVCQTPIEVTVERRALTVIVP